MNERFVNVKVDREERPDLDAVYMDAVVALTGHGGWPMTVFLTPAGEPFLGGTYFPPEPRHGLPALPPGADRRLGRVPRAARRGRRSQARALTAAIGRSAEARALARAADGGAARPRRRAACVRASTPVYGGWGDAPKFPPAPDARVPAPAAGDDDALRDGADDARRAWPRAACTTSSAAASTATPSTPSGSCRTSRRCSTTTRCSRRRTCTAGSSRARSATGASPSRRSTTCCGSCACPRAGFASAQDADTDGVEGLTFTWTAEEGAPPELLRPFEHGRSIIRGELDDDDARAAACDAARSVRSRCATTRRSRPGTGSRSRRSPRSRRRLDTAGSARRSDRGSGEFLLGPLSDGEGRLWRSFRDGQVRNSGYLDDYANVAHGLLELHVATGDAALAARRRTGWRASRSSCSATRSAAASSSRRATASSSSRAKKDLDDHPLPSGNSMLAHVLLRLARIYGDDELERAAVGVFRLVLPRSCARRQRSAGRCARSTSTSRRRASSRSSARRTRRSRAPRSRRSSRAPSSPSGPPTGVPLLEGKSLVDGRPAVYVCERFACRAPVTDPAELTPTEGAA